MRGDIRQMRLPFFRQTCWIRFGCAEFQEISSLCHHHFFVCIHAPIMPRIRWAGSFPQDTLQLPLHRSPAPHRTTHEPASLIHNSFLLMPNETSTFVRSFIHRCEECLHPLALERREWTMRFLGWSSSALRIVSKESISLHQCNSECDLDV